MADFNPFASSPYDYFDPEDISDPVSDGESTSFFKKHPWISCQYFVTNLPNACVNWAKTCTVKEASGYNNGNCDYLGTNTFCTHYEPGAVIEGWRCIAPNRQMSGVYTKVPSTTSDLQQYSNAAPEDIAGYNEALCDGEGLGRGSGAAKDLDKLMELPVKCNYYRPWSMGFGMPVPHPLSPAGKTNDLKAALKLAVKPLAKRMPLSFLIYNLRAKFQRCQWWAYPVGAEFVLDSPVTGGISLPGNIFNETKSKGCESENEEARKYADIQEFEGDVGAAVFSKVWSEAGTVVCNGAKPECPCYSGNWECITDKKMLDGMPISAQQVMELRYWSADWGDEEAYNFFFNDLGNANKNDLTTASINTYDGYATRSTNPLEAVIKGTNVKLCHPIPSIGKNFVPAIVLEIEKFNYASPSSTTTKEKKKETPNASFPTLIRNFAEVFTKNMHPLNIVYPYNTPDPFSLKTCEDQKAAAGQLYQKNSYLMDNDSITVIGSTVPSKRIYAYNEDKLYNNVSGLAGNKHYLSLTPEEYTKFNTECEAWLQDAVISTDVEIADHLIITESTTDGYFSAGPMEVAYKEKLNIVILVDFGDSTYGFIKRSVTTSFMGAVIVQDHFNHGFSGEGGTHATCPPGSIEGNEGFYLDVSPYALAGQANIQGNVKVVSSGGGSTNVVEIRRIISHESISMYSYKQIYSYALVRVVKETVIENWSGIPGTNKIWVELSNKGAWNTKPNSVFDWNFISGTMEGQGGTEACVGTGSSSSIELGLILGKTFSIEPGAMVLAPKDPKKVRVEFTKKEWVLTVKYYYYVIDFNKGDTDYGAGTQSTIVFPNPESPTTSLVEYEGDISFGDGFFNVDGTLNSTMKVVALLEDHKNRLCAASATKLLVLPTIIRCPSVEIKYMWSGSGKVTTLSPQRGSSSLTEGGAAFVGVDSGKAGGINTPHCGDHDLSWQTGVGPMYYPFDACRHVRQYHEFAGANYCTMPIEGYNITYGAGFCEGFGPITRFDFRLCGPYEFNAWATDNGQWLGGCIPDWVYNFSNLTDFKFIGWGKIKAGQSKVYAALTGEREMPFGDATRSYYEQWFSKDYVSHISLKGSPHSTSQWMPMVIDNEVLAGLSFNAFASSSATDPFSFVDQMSLHMNTNIDEKVVSSAKKTFKEAFEVVRRGICAYPKPLVGVSIEDGGAKGAQYVHYYKFRDEGSVWAWPEYWKPVDRNTEKTKEGSLRFLGIGYPSYVFDLYKEEFQITVPAGSYSLKYVGPKFNVEDSGEINIDTHPSLSIDGAEPLFFRFLYNNYDGSEPMEFFHESTSGKAGASGGGSSVYETMGIGNFIMQLADGVYVTAKQWLGDPAMLLLPGGSGSAEGPEELTYSYDPDTGESSKAQINPYLIAQMSSQTLNFLPLDISDPIQLTSAQIQTTTSLITDPIVITEMIDGEYKSPYDITIEGTWGISSIAGIGKPAVRVSYDKDVGDDVVVGGTTAASAFANFTAADKDNLQEYTLRVFFPVDPKSLVVFKGNTLTITITPPSNESMRIDNVTIRYADFTSEREEIIEVYERKYIISEGSLGGINMTGPIHPLQSQQDGDYSGQYFPARGAFPSAFTGSSKIRSVGATEEQDGEYELSLDLGNIAETEQTLQKSLYIDGFNKNAGSIKTNITLKHMLGGSPLSSLLGSGIYLGSGEFYSMGLPWKNHETNAAFVAAKFWTPKGHKFKWKGEGTYQKCWVRGPFEVTLEGEYVHVHAKSFGEDVFDPYVSLYFLRRFFGAHSAILSAPAAGNAPFGAGLNAGSY